MPELVLLELDPDLGRAEPDPEIQELIEASGGRNLGMDFLPAALPFGPPALAALTPEHAADVVWFDALVTNVDRTPRNPNLLLWHERVWLIDHGAALYLQHSVADLPSVAQRPFPPIREHVLLAHAGALPDADARLAPRLTPAEVAAAVDLVPDDWLADRAPYAQYLSRRLAEPRAFVEEAERARRAA